MPEIGAAGRPGAGEQIGAAGRTGAGEQIGAGERSARRLLVIDSALLMVIVLAVHLALVFQDGSPAYPLWAVALSWFAAVFTLVAGASARWLPDATLRVVALVAVIAYGVTLVTFPAAVPAEGIDRIPWTLSASGAAAATALVAGGRSLAWITVLAGTTAGIAYRTLYGGLDVAGIVNDMQALLTGAVICVIGGHILSVGRGLDAAAATSTAAVARESAEHGRLAARTRASTLVHDEVLATLNLAASDLPIPPALLAAQAAQAASMVSRLVDEQAEEPLVLRMALADEARRHRVGFSARGESTATVPAATQEALVGATRQALRNSLEHAPGSSCRVELSIDGGTVTVTITDDGPGFATSEVADDRLGIRQSIIGRMDRVAGGTAHVISLPGTGTVVRLTCSTTPSRRLDASGDRGALRAGLAAVAVIYLLTQTVCAIVASAAFPGTWPINLGLLLAALLASEILRRTPTLVPSRRRMALVVAIACGGLVAGTTTLPFSYGTSWFAVAYVFVFVALALRGRLRVALYGGVFTVALLVATGVVTHSPASQIVPVTVRLVVLIILTAAILLVVARMQRRIAALHHDTVASAERESWTVAARSELTTRVAELGRTVIPLLERIARSGTATAAERREYATLEGELRDSLRAGSLAREPLVSVVAAARDRGVDVVLLDDSGGSIPDELVDPVLVWMASAISAARTRAVGRLLPPQRGGSATVTVDSNHSEYGAAAAAVQSDNRGEQVAPGQGPVINFHGE
ncbi:hypothetical protein B7R54_11065 [Subtercola boreus]|uniref:Histidine kinase/HSP90-like ATPase domain-containing protein n=1 Tax=Subtercola boreus TaxID=120213 RepID=A0A3E0VIB6_9MICO|nr:sensor histidine kinase [Subtercola boreus]RFA09692.1 hypothetical protein B7R54_11065 [Subtercola boreus]TQL53216.1 signal transduction histidine kinase [Subtercola boreus]